uniref:Cytochrome P450 n=1 Tax=Meloidogyne incognita TaxID=6306 RepID=A0A914NEG3_MELIC
MLLILIISAFFLFWTAIRKNNYWKNRGIPGPEPSPWKGNIDLIFNKNPSSLQLFDWSKKYGRIYGIKNGWFNTLVISEPEMVKELLFDKFETMYGHMVNPMIGNVNTNSMAHLFATKGRRWKRLRHIANPAFSTFNLKRALPIIDDTIQNNIKILKNTYLPGNYLNIVDYFTELTFDVIYRLAMGQKDSKEFCQLSRDTLTVFNNNIFDYLSYIFPWLGLNVLSPFLGATGNLRRDPGQILIEKIYEAVIRRKEEKLKKNKKEEEEDEENLKNKKWVNFIDLFLESEAENVELKEYSGTFNRSEKVEKNERRNSIDEIVMNLFLFLLTGFDTTANTLSLIAHNLVIYPQVQKRLFEEIEEICGLEEGEIINYEQLAKLKYADAVFYETQRLCPMAAALVFFIKK